MKVPKPRKLSSGNWFIQLRLGGESVSVTEPSEKQCIKTAQLVKAEYLAGKRLENTAKSASTLREAIDAYITSRSNTLSPSTLRGYSTIRDNRFSGSMDKCISDIKDWQTLCNEEAKKCSAKTLQNSWRFVASVLRYAEVTVPRVTLPQVVVRERPYLEPDQISPFLKAVKGRACEIPALLALHSLRRSEICALKWDNIDLEKGRMLVDGAMVPNEKHKFIYKETNKNNSSRRYVPIIIPELAEAVKKREKTGEYVIQCSPETIIKQINRICKAEGFPQIGVHGLRHSFASLAYHLGVPEKIAMQIGGWADDGTMRKIYTHLSQKDVNKYGEELANFFKNANENANDAEKSTYSE